MISNRNYVRLIPALLVATSLFLSACQGSKQDFATRTAKKRGADTSAKVQGRMVLAEEMKQFIKDPTELAAYKSSLSAAFDKLSEESNYSWSSLFKVKTWLIGSEELTKQATEAISLTLDTTGTKYVVRQTQYEVLVDEAYLNKMTVADQAKLILREFLTSVYTLKHLSDEQLCTLMKESLSVKECIAGTSDGGGSAIVPSQTEKISKEDPLTNKSMTKSDSDRVETVAKFFEAQSVNLTATALFNKMNEQQFDVRVFKYILAGDKTNSGESVDSVSEETGSGQSNKSEVISAEAREMLIEGMKSAAENDEMLCQTLQDDSSGVKCHLSVEEMTNSTSSAASGLTTLTVKSGNALIVNDTIYGATRAANIAVAIYKNQSGAEFVIVPLTSVGISEKKVGAKYRAHFILARVDEARSYSFAGLISVAGVIKEVTGSDAETCVGQWDSKEVSLLVSKEKNLIQRDLLQRNPTPPCW